jgi:hypothetical protein
MAKNHCKGKARPVKTPHNRTLTVDKFYHYYIPSKDAPPGTSNRSISTNLDTHSKRLITLSNTVC